METDTVLVWRFLAADHRLSRAFEADQRLGGRPTPPISPINAGDVLHGRDWRESSLLGLHGWQKMSDALHYGRGMVVARLRLSGEIRYQRRYRIEATEASVLWLADASHLLNDFAVLLAERELLRERTAGREPDPRLWSAIAVRRAWLDGIVIDAELQEAMQATMEVMKESELQWRSRYFEAAAEWSRLAQIRQYMKRGEEPQPGEEERARLDAEMRTAEARMTESVRAQQATFQVSKIAIASSQDMWQLVRSENRDPFGYELKNRLVQAFAPEA